MSKAMEDRIRKAEEEETGIETTVHLIKEIMESMKMTAEQVMTMMNISDDDRTAVMKKMP
ncbi:MAG: hypothetical protein Q4C02_10045 [Eubacteriales bacterium]|nr:hypothetical protein [Lachnospiraceae bacterium]MDO4418601.1 hypothetical protein [Eubacteriales bacterium]